LIGFKNAKSIVELLLGWTLELHREAAMYRMRDLSHVLAVHWTCM
jgi:hypothetical protein